MVDLTPIDRFQALVRDRFPMISGSLEENLHQGGERVRDLANTLLPFYARVMSWDLERMAGAFARMTLEVNRLQLRYEMSGRYAVDDYETARRTVYDQRTAMENYMIGLVCSQFAWSNHFSQWCFFEDRFLTRRPLQRILEMAPGHGWFGLSALKHHAGATLLGIDISATSVEMSRRVCQAAATPGAEYRLMDAMNPAEEMREAFDAVLCGELLEHVPEPERILAAIARTLKADGIAYVTVAITAAAPDHIYEFEDLAQVTTMVTAAGLAIVEQHLSATWTLTPRAKGPPRTLAMILQKT